MFKGLNASTECELRVEAGKLFHCITSDERNVIKELCSCGYGL